MESEAVLRLWSNNGDIGTPSCVLLPTSFNHGNQTRHSGSSNTERLWKEYFADPSQWWDRRNSKTNPRTPDFKHKITEESLWIDGWYNPNWVKGMFEKSGFANKGMHKAASREPRDNSGWEMLSSEALSVEVGVCDPQQVCTSLVDRNESSWTSHITSYVECGELQQALILYQKMKEESVHVNGRTLKALLKGCARLKDAKRGKEIHAEIARNGLLERDPSVGNALVDMCAKCGLFSEAWEVLEKFPVRDAFSWNALIRAYVERGLGQKALNCFKQMQLEGIAPDAVTFVCSLKACGNIGAIDMGQEIHAEIARKGLEINPFVGNALVNMYAKCGLLSKAQEVFDLLPVQDEVSWTALIAGYANHGLGQEALNCFIQMQLEGIAPDAVTFVCSLKACGSLGAIHKGQEIHLEIARKGLLEVDFIVGKALVDMYAKCGSLTKAREVFDKLPVRDEVLWTALMAGYTEYGFAQEALDCFQEMQLEGIPPNTIAYVCSLKACGCIGAIDKGREIHAEISRKGWLEKNHFVGSTLVDMYAKCGSLATAQEVFEQLPVRDVVSWNALISGYANYGIGQEALNCFKQMQLEGIAPDAVTFISSLKACGSTGAIDKGQEIHAELARRGSLERNVVVGSTLVDMYAKCGLLAKACEVFDKLPVRDAVSWNALISGFANHGLGQEALNCLGEMQLESVSPNDATFVCSLKACGNIRAIDKGREIHAEISRRGLLERNPFLGDALVDMYVKCGLFANAQEVFDKLPVPTAVSWNALIVGYVNHGLGPEALNCFEQMQLQGVSPTAITYVSSLNACACIGATDKGQDIHAQIAKKGLLEVDPFIGNALVDMYAKCGLLSKAQEVFDNLPVRDAVSWNTLIAGYARVGESENVFYMLDRMRGEGIKPDGITFLSVLTVCSHAGLVDKGQAYFEAMSKDGITPTSEHYTCMVDLLGRAGYLDKAVAMMNNMPCNPDLVMWRTLLGACQKWGNVELARQVFEHAVQLDEKDAGAYVLMSNIYAYAHAGNESERTSMD